MARPARKTSDTLVRWQEQRFLWLLMAIAMGGLIIPAHSRSSKSVFCHYAVRTVCVYIRYAMFVMVIAVTGDKSQK